jgi:ribonuclease VapC
MSRAPVSPIAVDTSALIIAMIEEKDGICASILRERPCLIGWPTFLEFRMVLQSKTDFLAIEPVLQNVLDIKNVRMVDFSQTHFWAATSAFSRFGKGSGHKAGLNYGDCMAYAVAKVADVPLLFVGNDFMHTDLAVLPL